jgi:hypothetical protein
MLAYFSEKVLEKEMKSMEAESDVIFWLFASWSLDMDGERLLTLGDEWHA